MARALISCSDENELAGGYCSPMDGSCSKYPESDLAGGGSSGSEVPWLACRPVAGGVWDASCAGSDCDCSGDSAFCVEEGRGGSSMEESDRAHIGKRSQGSYEASMKTRSGIMRERDASLVRAQRNEIVDGTRKCVEQVMIRELRNTP